ncbi:MAG TPA: winged helix DNA-binding domain-containing protein [Ornithinibacter sp.]|nr:winged helix DNA-binding domain-containing protein [Ornithinibacter sp.]
MAARTLRDVHRRRLAAQRVTGPALRCGAHAVRLLGCVQAQDAPLAAWSLAMRLRPGTTYAGVLAEQAAGGWVRTHVLRPTWHLIAPEDLRWVQRATAARVESSLGGRHRGLGLDDTTTVQALAVLESVLAGPTPLVRREVAAAFGAAGLPTSGEQVGHLLLTAELRAVICSGPSRGAEHTYVLVDEVIPSGPPDSLEGADARRELARRFVAGHGPASERDLGRWSTLTLGQARTALAELSGELERVVVDGQVLWVDPRVPARTTRAHAAHLLPTFDEVCLTYASTGFPRRDPAVARSRLLSEAGGGIVVVGGDDVGTWKRVVSPGGVRVSVSSDVPLGVDERDAVGAAAERLAAFLERPLDLVVETPSG